MNDAEKQAERGMVVKQLANQIKVFGQAHVVVEDASVVVGADLLRLNYVYTVGRHMLGVPELIAFRQSDIYLLGSLFAVYGAFALPARPTIGNGQDFMAREIRDPVSVIELYMPYCRLFFEGIGEQVQVQQVLIADNKGRFMPDCGVDYRVPLL